ncbi:putative phospholipid hydroperoxide glutathione peroxidase [Prunus yedoensis var. nudiflora]|uniref:Glutathione peroxidase n=1 Tax=Prunus yedoensis var. nudiflora TaxID=2094558 RepID=A0A314UAY5_PRUYE|nr:putative phospholipid hydroperoxide glutathione peroxidase [Prunus yedoensis var. nudiflora]
MASQPTEIPKTFYDFTVKDAKGNDADLSVYKGKVLLVINVASKCGLTNSNYTELNELHQKYKDQGLEILAFPCNQFGAQEPGSNEEIEDFVCTRFKSEFPIFDKAGKWGFFGDDIQWNFTKFLVDKDGKVSDRYYPTTPPLALSQMHKGLEILAFPCNQFAAQEPGSNQQIEEFVCTRFKSGFQIFDKIEVNGDNAAPLYKFLRLGKWGFFDDDIQWNFAKFLVDKEGKVVNRYYPTTLPFSLEHDIKKLLAESHEC